MQTIQREFNRKSHGPLPVALLLFFGSFIPGAAIAQINDTGRAYLYPYPPQHNQQYPYPVSGGQQIVRWDQPPLKPWSVAIHASDTFYIDFVLDTWAKIWGPGNGGAPHGQENVTLPISLDTNVVRILSFTCPDSLMWASPWAHCDSCNTRFENGRLIVTVFGIQKEGGGGAMGFLTCTARLALGDSTTISLGPCQVTLNDTPYFVADSLPSVVNIIELGGCGDSLLLRLMAGEPLFRIVSVVPNPASGELEVRVADADPATLNIEMYDALGRAVIPVQDAAWALARGTSLRDPVTLDVSSLAEGIYYLRISSGGFVQTRSISIQR